MIGGEQKQARLNDMSRVRLITDQQYQRESALQWKEPTKPISRVVGTEEADWLHATRGMKMTI